MALNLKRITYSLQFNVATERNIHFKIANMSRQDRAKSGGFVSLYFILIW